MAITVIRFRMENTVHFQQIADKYKFLQNKFFMYCVGHTVPGMENDRSKKCCYRHRHDQRSNGMVLLLNILCIDSHPVNTNQPVSKLLIR